MRRIWIVEDEPDIADLVAHNLRKEQYNVGVFHDGESFLESLENEPNFSFKKKSLIKRNKEEVNELPDLVILDLMLPGIDGLEVCRMMRSNERTKGTPIIILTAKAEELDVVLGLELGADDYVVKPFSVRELIARIKAVLRRMERPQNEELIRFEGLSVNLKSFEVKVDDSPVELTYAEFKALRHLISKPGRVFTRQQIIDGIWDEEYRVVTLKTVDVHVAHLREKLGKYGKFIKTVRGVGYKFET